jgi:hypothetical protein
MGCASGASGTVAVGGSVTAGAGSVGSDAGVADGRVVGRGVRFAAVAGGGADTRT